MGLSTKKISLERVTSLSTIPKDTPSIRGRETGPDTNHGNPPPSNFHGTFPGDFGILWHRLDFSGNKCFLLPEAVNFSVSTVHQNQRTIDFKVWRARLEANCCQSVLYIKNKILWIIALMSFGPPMVTFIFFYWISICIPICSQIA